MLLDGRATVVRTTPEGREELLALRGRGDTLGEIAAIDPAPRMATVTALEEVASLVVAGERFVGFLSERPAAMFTIAATARPAQSRVGPSPGRDPLPGGSDPVGPPRARAGST